MRFIKSFLIPFLVITFGCSKDDVRPADAELFLGTWDFHSWLEDGEELIGQDKEYRSFWMQFFENGNMEWREIDTKDRVTIFPLLYSLNEDDNELTLSDSVDELVLSYDISPERLKLEGNMDGFFQIMRAVKRE